MWFVNRMRRSRRTPNGPHTPKSTYGDQPRLQLPSKTSELLIGGVGVFQRILSENRNVAGPELVDFVTRELGNLLSHPLVYHGAELYRDGQ